MSAEHRLASVPGGHPVIPLPVHWRMGAHGDPIAVFDYLVLHLHPDGSVTWSDQSEAREADPGEATHATREIMKRNLPIIWVNSTDGSMEAIEDSMRLL